MIDHNTFVLDAVTAKLSPDRIRLSGKFTAIVAFLLGQKWTNPRIIGLCITSDGLLMVATTDDPFFDEIAGDAGDLERNMRDAAKVAELTDEELTAFLATRSRIRDWRS